MLHINSCRHNKNIRTRYDVFLKRFDFISAEHTFIGAKKKILWVHFDGRTGGIPASAFRWWWGTLIFQILLFPLIVLQKIKQKLILTPPPPPRPTEKKNFGFNENTTFSQAGEYTNYFVKFNHTNEHLMMGKIIFSFVHLNISILSKENLQNIIFSCELFNLNSRGEFSSCFRDTCMMSVCVCRAMLKCLDDVTISSIWRIAEKGIHSFTSSIRRKCTSFRYILCVMMDSFDFILEVLHVIWKCNIVKDTTFQLSIVL